MPMDRVALAHAQSRQVTVQIPIYSCNTQSGLNVLYVYMYCMCTCTVWLHVWVDLYVRTLSPHHASCCSQWSLHPLSSHWRDLVCASWCCHPGTSWSFHLTPWTAKRTDSLLTGLHVGPEFLQRRGGIHSVVFEICEM